MDISGKVAVVTGAGAGIGRATAALLASRGAHVLVVDVARDAAEETQRTIDAEGGSATALVADVTDPAGITAMFAAAERSCGGVDIVHNNAGVLCGEPVWPDTPLDRIARTVAVNLGGVAMGTAAGIRALRARGGGAIVNTASVAALGPLPDDPTYSATKAGIVRITESCAGFAASAGIRVNCVLPGPVDTDMTIKHSGDGTRPGRWLADVLAATPLLTADDVAKAVLMLIEDDTKVARSWLVTAPLAAGASS